MPSRRKTTMICRLFRRLGSAAAFVLLVCALSGCNPSAPPTTTQSSPTQAGSQPESPLKVLVVDDPSLGAAIARHWKAETESELEVREITAAELLSASRLPADVVLFANGQLGQLVENGLIVPLDEKSVSSEKFDRRDLFDQVRLHDISWGNRTVAVPLGSPQLLLIYRLELLEKAGLNPPQTWADYQTACEQLAAKVGPSDGGKPAPRPAIEPLAEGWAGQTLLARSAAYATHRDQISPLFDYETMEPLIVQPPYVRALTELVAAGKHFPPGERLTPAEAVELVQQGQFAMALAWLPTVATKAVPGPTSLGVALPPGSEEAFNFATEKWELRAADEPRHVPLLGVSGRLGAVSSSAANPQGAESFLLWLASSKVSSAVSPASPVTTLFRLSQQSDPQRWVANANNAQKYAQIVEQSQSLPRHLSLRLPGRERYLAALDAAVLAAVAGEKSPEEALAAAAGKWREITTEIGVAKQMQANRRSLGMQSLE